MDELKNIMSESTVIPEGCLNCMEEASYIAYAIDEDFNELLEKCGAGSEVEVDAEEDTELEEAVILTEATENKVVAFFQSVWAKIKAMFENAIKWIKEQVAKIKQHFIDKKIKNLKEKLNGAAIDGKAELGTFHTGANIANTSWMDVTHNRIAKVKAVKAGAKTAGNIEDEMKKLPSEIAKSVNAKEAKDVSDDCSITNMKEFMRKGFLGEEVKVNGYSFSKVKDELFKLADGQKSINDVKAAYNKARKSVNDIIKIMKSHKEQDNEFKTEAHKMQIKYFKLEAQILAAGNGVQLDCIKQQIREAFGVLARATKHVTKKEEKKTAKNEAADIFAW